MTCNAPLTGFQSRLGNRPAEVFYPDGFPAGAAGASPVQGSLEALAGIDLAVESGALALAWQAEVQGGSLASGTIPLTLEPRGFPLQSLSLPRRLVEPDSADLRRIRAEERLLSDVLSRSAPRRLWRGPFAPPVPGAQGGGFGARRVINGRPSAPHAGIDIAASSGTAVLAPNAGVVVLADTLYYGGTTVVLDHGLGLFTLYAHLSLISVHTGGTIERGRLLGRVGATGRATGPHLHWAARLNGARVDPAALMAATSGAGLAGPVLGHPAPARE